MTLPTHVARACATTALLANLLLSVCATGDSRTDLTPTKDLDPMIRAALFLSEDSAPPGPQDAADVSANMLVEDPEPWLGSWVRVLGTFSTTSARSIQTADGNERDSWHSILVHGGPSFTYVVTADSPPYFSKKPQNVIVTGRFAGLHSYEARNGATVIAPLLVVCGWQEF